jgi:hypothetical protein
MTLRPRITRHGSNAAARHRRWKQGRLTTKRGPGAVQAPALYSFLCGPPHLGAWRRSRLWGPHTRARRSAAIARRSFLLPAPETTKKLTRGSHAPASQWKKRRGRKWAGVRRGVGPEREEIGPRLPDELFLFFPFFSFLIYFLFSISIQIQV